MLKEIFVSLHKCLNSQDLFSTTLSSFKDHLQSLYKQEIEKAAIIGKSQVVTTILSENTIKASLKNTMTMTTLSPSRQKDNRFCFVSSCFAKMFHISRSYDTLEQAVFLYYICNHLFIATILSPS